MGVVPIEQEINNTKRQIDDAEWEGEPYEHLQRHLDRLLQEMQDGELWYPKF